MKQEEECKRGENTDVRFNVKSEVHERLNQQEQQFDSDFQMRSQSFSAPSQAKNEDSLMTRGYFETDIPNKEHSLSKVKEASTEKSFGDKILKSHDLSTEHSIPIRSRYVSNTPREDEVIEGMQLPACMRTSENCKILHSAPKVPPVTISTLNELNLQWIQQNINLRIDINYDHDLHFMPISGTRGEEKRRDAEQYWQSLTLEFMIYQHGSSATCQICQKQPSQTQYFFADRLPEMFRQLRALLFTLVPEADRDQVNNNLDIELLMQQVRHGVLDVIRLSQWLARLLTSHCAPVRDALAEDMAQQITSGASQGDMSSLVCGLEKLFSFLEAMKLDVANHQIRTFRYPLIEDGVAFQQDYFSIRLRNGKLNLEESSHWYRSINAIKTNSCGFKNIVNGLVQLCMDSELQIPFTLKYDSGRIRQIQEEIQDVMHLDICLEVFDQLLYRLLGREICPAVMHEILKNRMLKTRIMTLTDEDNDSDAGICDIWTDHIDSIAIEIARAAYTVCQKAGHQVSDSVFLDTQWQLRQRFDNEQYKHCKAEQLSELMVTEVVKHASVFRTMSPSSISEVQRRFQQARQASNHARNVPDVEDISRRLAHLATIHWRVWNELAYGQA